jgi:hypothetical protein
MWAQEGHVAAREEVRMAGESVRTETEVPKMT